MASYRIQNSNLLCKNNCGFYGNPSWDGYCSVCYRKSYTQQDPSRSAVINISSASVQALSRFEAKRKQLAGRGATVLKNIFRISKDGTRERNSTLPEECYVAVSEFRSFLANLKASTGADVSQMVTKLLDDLDTMGGSHINQYSLVIQNFYQHASDRISKSSLYSNLSPAVRDKLENAIERFVTTWIYCWAFASTITDDETADLQLQEKLRSLYWVTPALLDSPIDPLNQAEMELIEEASLALNKVNTVYASEDKLEQISKCCLKVFAALDRHQQQNRPRSSSPNPDPSAVPQPSAPSGEVVKESKANADDFLPTLIWVVINANPPQLQSNLRFVMRFADQKRLNSGQAGYFFTNLSCAAHYLINLTHKSLNMTERQFYGCMRTGLAPDKRSGRQCEGELILSENEVRLFDIEERLRDFEEDKLKPLEQELQKFDANTRRKLETLKARVSSINVETHRLDPLHLENPFSLSVDQSTTVSRTADGPSLLDLDDDDHEESRQLPEPIQPIPCHLHRPPT